MSDLAQIGRIRQAAAIIIMRAASRGKYIPKNIVEETSDAGQREVAFDTPDGRMQTLLGTPNAFSEEEWGASPSVDMLVTEAEILDQIERHAYMQGFSQRAELG